MDLSKFRNPDSILRPAPFWAINDRITPEETARQLNDMRDVGLSGGFFHSRAGLITDYLGDEWFAAMDAAIEAARERDGYVWLYDEDLWPSGNAGGQVAGMKDDYRSATLAATLIAAGEPLPPDSTDEALRAVYAIKNRTGITLEDFEQLTPDKFATDTTHERLVLRRVFASKIGWWGGESYANLLNPEAMREFVKLTHDVYAKRLGHEFGKRVPGIFTDEPQIAQDGTHLPWYDGLPDPYNAWTGRSLWADMPFLFFEGPEGRKIRLLFHRVVLRQFVESFSKPIFEWCEAHGIEHTGHYNAEDSIGAQIRNHSGGIMAHYRYQHAPGIDHLCRQNDWMLLTVKQVSSAARQLGRSRVLDEIFGVSRHTNTFEDFKWLGDYDLVLGANFFVPHLTWYSARGRRKRDYPPVWNYQQTYWKDLGPLNDYFTRVAHALTLGKPGANILVLHNIESATAGHRFGCAPAPATWKPDSPSQMVPRESPTEDFGASDWLDRELRRTLDAILNAGYDADLGDEGYIEDIGAVEGRKFGIGEMSYDVVVVPQSVTWRPTTFRLLSEFIANGGKVIFLGSLPQEIDCDPAEDKWLKLAAAASAKCLPASLHNVQSAVDELAPRTFSLRSSTGQPTKSTYLQHRIDGDEDIFFVVNSDRSRESEYVLDIFAAGGRNVYLLDAVSGTVHSTDAKKVGNSLAYTFTLPPCGSALITVSKEIAEALPAQKKIDLAGAEIVPLPTTWDFERLDPNVLVMDRIDASLDGGTTWLGEDMDFRIRVKLAEHFGTSDALAWQPWVAIRKGLFDGKGGEVVLRYRFESEIDSPKSAFLVIEDLTKGRTAVNGQSVDLTNAGWHWDRGFGKVDISKLIRKGENIVSFTVNYDFLTEVEPTYIVGDFGVALSGLMAAKLVSEPSKLNTGSWLSQGYPFYSGRMVYRAAFEAKQGAQTVLRLNNPSGILYKVRLNGSDAGNLLWRPFELDLTPLVKNGGNELEIEVISSLQNTWGPLHEKSGDDNMWCGPNAFEDEYAVRPEFSLFDYGLLGGAAICRGRQ